MKIIKYPLANINSWLEIYRPIKPPLANINYWLEGYRAMALVSYDDLSPRIDIKLIDEIFINNFLKKFPYLKIQMFCIAKWMDEDRNNIEDIENQLWLNELKKRIQDNNLYLGFHGYTHCNLNYVKNIAAEFANLGEKESYNHLSMMMQIFKNSDLPIENVFRPPAWAVNIFLLKYLSENDIALCDMHNSKSEMIGINTSNDKYNSSYFELDEDKKIIRIPWASKPSNGKMNVKIIDEYFKHNGFYVIHNHFDDGDNRISEANNHNIQNALEYISKNYGRQFGFCSYGEAMYQFKRQLTVKWRLKEENNILKIYTNNKKEELEGCCWEIYKNFEDICIINKGEILHRVYVKNRKRSYIVVHPVYNFDVDADGYILIKRINNNTYELYTWDAKLIIIKGINKLKLKENNTRSNFEVINDSVKLTNDGKENTWEITL